MRPLDGIVVLDLTRLLPGAAATMLLADFGAEVIKIEEPGRGDYARSLPPVLDGQGAVFALTNRGKKSVALDLKDPRGRNALLRLAASADVLVEGFRPGVMTRLRLDYDILRAHNERLVYLALTGYGQSGPYSGMAGHDINYLSLGGILGITGPRDGAPAIPGTQVADLAGGAMQAVIGILLALAARERTGRGQMVDVSMLDGVVSMLPVPMALYAATGRIPERGVELLSGRYACYNVYEAKDGRSIAVGALEPKFWAAFCRGIGCEQFIADQFAGGAGQIEIIAAVSDLLRTRTAAEWMDLLRPADVCVSIVHNIAEVVEDPHLHERKMILPKGQVGVTPKLGETPGHAGGPAPRLGEHTREVLLRAGLPEREIDEITLGGKDE